MAKLGFTRGRTGRRPQSGGFSSIEEMKWNPGETNRLFIPLREDKDGNKEVILFGSTIHRLTPDVSRERLGEALIGFPKKNGGTYSPFEIRCTHPYNQLDQDDAVKFAEKGEMCVLCEYERYQRNRQFDALKQEFGTEENDYEDGGDNFKELTNKEKREFYSNHPIDIEAPYFTKVNKETGETYTEQVRQMYLLVMEMDVTERIVEREVKGKLRKRRLRELNKNEDGTFKVTPKFLKVSASRMDKIKNAIDTAVSMEQLDEEHLSPYIENEGTELEEEVLVGWVDLEFSFPEGERMTSAKDVKVTAVPEKLSFLINEKELRGQVEEKIDKVADEAYQTFSKVYKNLNAFSRDEMLSLLTPSAKEEFYELRKQYRTDKTEEHEKEVYKTILDRVNNNSSDDSKEDTDEKKEEKPKKETKEKKETKTKTKAKTKKVKPKEEELVEEDSEDDELDESADFDDDDLFN